MTNRLRETFLAWAFAMALAPAWAVAAPPPARPASAPAAAASAASSPDNKSCPDAMELAKVVKVDGPITVVRQKAPADPASAPTVALGDEISVHVQGLAKLRAHAQCSSNKAKIVLFLDGRPIASAPPYPPTDPLTETFHFVLKQDDESRETWTHLLGRPSFDPREIDVSVGLQTEHPVASGQTVRLQTIALDWFWTWAVLLILLSCAFCVLAVRSNLLRDIGPQPPAPARKPYSLAKMQAAWWFFLVLASYLFIGLVAGDYNTSITGTVLALMGISAATAVGSATIDAGKLDAAAPPVTRGKWWLDVLSDSNGVNFHRFQMAAWTLVLGVIFVHDVYVGLAMPKFDNTLLGLLGISAGTFLGMKTTTEK